MVCGEDWKWQNHKLMTEKEEIIHWLCQYHGLQRPVGRKCEWEEQKSKQLWEWVGGSLLLRVVLCYIDEKKKDKNIGRDNKENKRFNNAYGLGTGQAEKIQTLVSKHKLVSYWIVDACGKFERSGQRKSSSWRAQEAASFCHLKYEHYSIHDVYHYVFIGTNRKIIRTPQICMQCWARICCAYEYTVL